MTLIINVLSNNGDIGQKKSEALSQVFNKALADIESEFFINLEINPLNLLLKLESKKDKNDVKNYNSKKIFILIHELLDSIFIEKINSFEILFENFDSNTLKWSSDLSIFKQKNPNIVGVGKKIKYNDSDFEIDIIKEPNYIKTLPFNNYSKYNLRFTKDDLDTTNIANKLSEALNTLVKLDDNLKQF
ncbi:hypothetical protein [Macrococcus equipercicus]|uniref:Uncharacterized protein n=1 Tax=Macrococcus equipercicus TaxID=69967 RepID=A0A9Q9BUP5_9STAP|nr:hypothetical protein [Macrococcus equipercicus]UTH13283.1 hypothetical protein KFV11_08410 [Macrococcus equipercicus]